MKKWICERRVLILAVILGGCLLSRLWRVDYPLMDWHSFRQADTASVTREFVKHHYPIWRPHYHDLGNIQSGLDNIEGDRMVEFPLVNYVLAIVLQVMPKWDLVVLSRLAAALASCGSAFCLYFLVKKLMKQSKIDDETTEIVALLSAGVFAFLPYSIYYGRVILPEPFQVFFGLLALVSFGTYLEKSSRSSWLVTALSLMTALLMKPTTVFWGPLFLLLAWWRWGTKMWRRGDLWLLAITAILPLGWWRFYIRQFPAGIPASRWLLNGPMYGTPPRWRPMWWRWLFYERLVKLWLGWSGIVVAAAGLWPWKRDKQNWCERHDELFLLVWLGLDFVYLSVFATGNIQHDYYQYLLLPSICWLVARGIYTLVTSACVWLQKKTETKTAIWMAVAGISFLVVVSWWLSWRQVRGFFDVNRWDQVAIGQTAAKMLPSQALVIAHSGSGDTNFLFQTDRRGWPSALDLEEKLAVGAQYLVGTDTDDLYHYLDDNFVLIYQDKNGFIFDLQASKEAELTPGRE